MVEVDCVYFDLGGVLYDLDLSGAWERFRQRCGRSIGEIQAVLYASDLIEPYESGKISSHAFYDEVTGRLGCRMSFDDFRGIWNSILVKREGMFQLALQVRKSLDVLVVSNTNEMNAAAMEKDVRNITRKTVYSHEVGYLKPDPRIYEKALEISGTGPQKTLYFDDLEKNVSAARTLGIHAFLFQDMGGLLKVFNSCGLRLDNVLRSS